MAKAEVLDGARVYFIARKLRLGEWIGVGNCNADDHWIALNKFERGLGMAEPLERGKVYKISDSGAYDGRVFMRFVY